MTALLERAPLAAGHEWPDGDNDPAIPRIPGIPAPRTEPVPVKIPQQPGPQPSSSLTCCGRPMRRDGRQLVCGKCGGWTDTSLALALARAVASPAVARQCGTCKGQGGKEVDTSSGGVIRKTWKSCAACRGRGTC
ncbi:hypothetical protein GCM10010346_16260 [Streptomyces chryseus]|uniref:Uncharacterized protein n=2 Tax=Streptomyces chryseus TaxID=68186 RepID=A0ABQ3DGX5_9ACTN|nr:hypothetical protein GCM10010346_16260 [Streptomyces chryseus]